VLDHQSHAGSPSIAPGWFGLPHGITPVKRHKQPEPIQQPDEPSQLGPIHLTPRERDILELLVEGLGDAEIARALGLSPRTISWYISELLKRTNTPSRVALAVYAIRNHLIE
jgi:DNA-binding NarL/FixJ family response regulator